MIPTKIKDKKGRLNTNRCPCFTEIFTSKNININLNIENDSTNSSIDSNSVNLNSASKYKCDTCESEFDCLNDLTIHTYDAHSNFFKCSNCEKSFNSRIELTKHFNENHLEKSISVKFAMKALNFNQAFLDILNLNIKA